MQSEPSSEALKQFLDAGEEAARIGAEILEEWRHRFQVRQKARFDLVTEADITSQAAIRSYLGQRFPDHAFLGEEGSHRAGPDSDGRPTWIVDPLDGTTNYVHGFPMYCVSVGLQVGGELVAGVIHDPSRHEVFRAAKGLGAWLGNQRLGTSQTGSLEDALLTTGFPPDTRDQKTLFTLWENLSHRAQSLRRTGSTALNLAYLAAGRCDGYWAFDNHVWDVAAGVVLVREAGGTITNFGGGTYDPYRPDAIASNGPLHPALLACIREVVKPPAAI